MEQMESIQVWDGQGARILASEGWTNLVNNYRSSLRDAMARAESTHIRTILGARFELLGMGFYEPMPHPTSPNDPIHIVRPALRSQDQIALFKRRAEQRELIIEDMMTEVPRDGDLLLSALRVCKACCRMAMRSELPV